MKENIQTCITFQDILKRSLFLKGLYVDKKLPYKDMAQGIC